MSNELNNGDKDEKCQTISWTDFTKLIGYIQFLSKIFKYNSYFLKCLNFSGEQLYRQAIEAASKFNQNLDKDRRRRLPYLETQTRTVQTQNNILCLQLYQRLKNTNTNIDQNNNQGQVYSYPLKKWYKRKRYLTDSSDTGLFFEQTHQIYLQHRANLNTSNSLKNNEALNESNRGGVSSGLSMLHTLVTKDQEFSRQSHSYSSTSLLNQNQNLNRKNSNEEERSGYVHFKDENFDADYPDSDAGSDYGDKKRKKKSKHKKGKTSDNQSLNNGQLDDKPYVCDSKNFFIYIFI
jgi:hypothetical protein